MHSPGIFKAYDIRGVVPGALDGEFAQHLGLAFGELVRREGERGVAVGRDGRLSSPTLADSLIRGLMTSGVDVIELGAVTTPMLYFAAHTLVRSGIQVTASHNPRDHNGFKLTLGGRTLHGDDLQALRRRIDTAAFATPTDRGTAKRVDVLDAYTERIAADVRPHRRMRVVLDCGNGVAGASAPRVLRAIGCDVVELYCDVDGRFPNHHPDPGDPRNLQALIAKVQQAGAELGLALDGDGDRLGVVTRTGHVIYPDRQLMLLAQDLLARAPGASIVFDVKSSQRLPQAIAAAGGRPVMGPSGYALVKQRMQEVNAPLAGEMSGHIFFAERWFGFDDGTYSACRLLEILSRHDDASAVLDALPESCSTPEMHVPCADGEAHEVASRLAQMADFEGAQVCTLDGLRVDWGDGFGLVRASNTNPVLTVRFEGQTAEAMQRIEREMMALLRRVKPDAHLA
ncbi:MAG TPA: phosphomannomutase/phosphoglucomutase [Ramlibacter sp.]|nr:phosphomannomutase/phosphoglucomutase [Ramlibacter sp.]